MRTSLLFGLVAAVTIGATMQDPPPPAPSPEITISPIPPVQGDTMKVTYSGPLPVTLTVDFHPGEPFEIDVTDSDGVDVDVPADAIAVKVTGGNAPANGSVVSS